MAILVSDLLKKLDAVPMSVIEDIKAEIRSLKGTFPSEIYLKIIDKHISGKE